MQMLYLQSVKKDADINLYINSPGGVVDDTLAIYDIMRFLTCDVATYCIGRAESGGAVLFIGRQKGQAVHPPQRQGDDPPAVRRCDRGRRRTSKIQGPKKSSKTKDTLIKVMSKCCGQPYDRVKEDSEL